VAVLESTGSGWLVRTEGKFGPFTFRYHTRYRLDPERHLSSNTSLSREV
jgi:hypothetical protein